MNLNVFSLPDSSLFKAVTLCSLQEFKKKFESAILRGRDADATEDQQKKGQEKLKELADLVNKCIIRRTSALLTKYVVDCNNKASFFEDMKKFYNLLPSFVYCNVQRGFFFSRYLPVKVELVVCCKLSPIQASIYKKFISSEAVKSKMRGKKIALEARNLIIISWTCLVLT